MLGGREYTAAFARIGERAPHLYEFISGYATVAKLPAPLPATVEWRALLEDLAQQRRFRIVEPLPEEPGWFDRAQVEQALINLLKNAEESGSAVSGLLLQRSLRATWSSAAERLA